MGPTVFGTCALWHFLPSMCTYLSLCDSMPRCHTRVLISGQPLPMYPNGSAQHDSVADSIVEVNLTGYNHRQ